MVEPIITTRANHQRKGADKPRERSLSKPGELKKPTDKLRVTKKLLRILREIKND